MVDCPDVGPPLVVEVGEAVAVRTGPVPAGAPCLRGEGVRMVEALSKRGDRVVDEVPEDDRWLLDGLLATFDLPA